MRLLILILLPLYLFSTALEAEDKTPYKFILGANIYYGERNASAPWLAERYDCAINNVGGWPGFYDSLHATAQSLGKDFWCGPYSSSQEINVYDGLHPERQFNERLRDTAVYWKYIYATHYLDSLGISPESLVVHVSDDYVSITNEGDGHREYSLSGLPFHKRRFSYQYWNNTSSDTMFYPAGYVWLANGANPDARRAIAYAYRRHLIEDSAFTGPNGHHWTAYFMDNQYRGGYAPRLYSYYDINATSGGPTSGLDWYEAPGIGNDVNANTSYFDNSTLMIDSTIKAVLDSTCDANGLHRIYGFANVEKFSPMHLGAVLPYTNVNLENPVDYAKAWPNGWEQWYAMADTMRNHPERYISWLFMGDFLCSSNPDDWKFDSSRVYMTHYAFFLQVRDTNAFCSPARFNDTTRWREIYEVDLGEPDGPAYEISAIGSNYNKIAVMRRDYDGGNAVVLVRTAHGSADFVGDSVAVNVHGLYRKVNARADTSDIADSIFYLKPYMGAVLVSGGPVSQGPSVAASPAEGVVYIDSSTAITFSASDPDGLYNLRVNLVTVNGEAQIIDTYFPPGIPNYAGRFNYTWSDGECGYAYVTIYASDQEGHTTYNGDAGKYSVSSQVITIGEAVGLIAHIFHTGTPTTDILDATCDGTIDLGDPLYIINHVFRNGPPVCCE